MVTAEQARRFGELRLAGASTAEAMVILAAVADVDRIIELAYNPHQLRGPDGRWIKGVADGVIPSAAAYKPRVIDVHEQIHHTAVAEATARARLAVQGDLKAIQAQHKKDIAVLTRQVRSANQAMNERAELHEKSRARQKLAVHVGALTAGAVLAAVEAKSGVPDIIAVFTAIGPAVIQELIDWVRRL